MKPIDSHHRMVNTGQKLAICAAVLVLATFFGYKASPRWLILLVARVGTVVLVRRPLLGLLALVSAALVVPMEFSTGTAVATPRSFPAQGQGMQEGV